MNVPAEDVTSEKADTQVERLTVGIASDGERYPDGRFRRGHGNRDRWRSKEEAAQLEERIAAINVPHGIREAGLSELFRGLLREGFQGDGGSLREALRLVRGERDQVVQHDLTGNGPGVIDEQLLVGRLPLEVQAMVNELDVSIAETTRRFLAGLPSCEKERAIAEAVLASGLWRPLRSAR